MGNHRMYLGKRGDSFIQSLSSLNLVNDVATGMVDSVAGNDAEYKGAGCFRANGTDKIVIPYNAALDVQNIEFEFWFEFTNGVIEDGYLFNRWNNAGGAVFRFLISAGQVNFSIRDALNSTTSINITTASSLNITGLNIIKGRKYGTNVELDVNGVQASGVSVNNGIISRTTDFVFGQRQDSSTIFPLSNTNAFNISERELGISGAYIQDVEYWPIPNREIDGPVVYGCINGYNGNIISPTPASYGIQDYLFWYQQGIRDNSGSFVPAKKDLSSAADGNLLTTVQDGTRWINDGSKILNADVQILKDSDIESVWYDGLGVPKEITQLEYTNAVTNFPETYFGDIQSDYISNLKLKKGTGVVSLLLETTLLTEETTLI